MEMKDQKEPRNPHKPIGVMDRRKVKFEVYGEEMVEKAVKQSGNSGRIYLPPDWVGSRVKIIRID
jgi:putative transposon-encoded protein